MSAPGCPGGAYTHPDDTDTALDDRDGARRLWAEGFRPVHAHQLQRGQEVAYVETFFGASTGKVGVTRVEDVAADPYVVRVSTWDRGLVECDECDEVWVR